MPSMFNTSAPDPATEPTQTKPAHKPFPSITGSCLCNTIRYRLLTSPLFCCACHCPDCQKSSGSAFGLFLHIEPYNIHVISSVRPILVSQTRRPGLVSRHVECPSCKVELWGMSAISSSIVDLRVGTLDFPSLMEPDIHSFVESKMNWVRLPEGAKTVPRDYDYKIVWPKSSLRRLDVCLRRVAAAGKATAYLPGGDDMVKSGDDVGDGEKTPTAVEFGEGEDDEAFEKRFEETEKALQERLDKLSRKLEEAGSKGQTGLEKLTENLEITDGTDEKGKGTVKEGAPT